MDFAEFQKNAESTAIYPGKKALLGTAYVALGLAGEAGEVANKVKKVIRDNGGVVDGFYEDQIVDEMGDVLWYLSSLATELGVSLNFVASRNQLKLKRRAETGKLQGDGDRANT